MRARLHALPLLVFLLFTLSCTNGITVMSYNVENLFDDVDDGTEFRDYDPEKGKWDAEAFALRVDTIAEVVRKAVPGGPDILLLQEVENENALRALVGLPQGVHPFAVVPVGRPAVRLGPPRRKPVQEVAHADRFGTPFPPLSPVPAEPAEPPPPPPPPGG